MWVSAKSKPGFPSRLVISILSVSGPPFFADLPPLPLTVPAGGQYRLVVRFQPSAAGPRLEVSPTSLAFGSVTAGQTKDLTLTIRNTGTAPLTVASFGMSNLRFSVVSPGAPFTVAALDSRSLPCASRRSWSALNRAHSPSPATSRRSTCRWRGLQPSLHLDRRGVTAGGPRSPQLVDGSSPIDGPGEGGRQESVEPDPSCGEA